MKKLIKHKAFEILSEHSDLIKNYNIVLSQEYIYLCCNDRDENQASTYSDAIAEIYMPDTPSNKVWLIPIVNEDDQTLTFRSNELVEWGILLKELEKAFKE